METTGTNSCNGQCSKCSFQQRVFCAAYMSRNNYAMMETLLVKIESLQSEIAELRGNVNAIQAVDDELIQPFKEDTMGQAV